MNRYHNHPSTRGALVSNRKFEANITEYAPRNLKDVVFPATRSQLIQFVKQSHEERLPIYPVSTGRNWGQGSAMPVQDDCVLVNLSQMNAIREVNSRLRYAIVEPGVTQKQLSVYLQQQHPELVYPMTGSGTETSIVGNLMERGVSARGHRYNTLVGLEVVLGTGELVRTGMWHFAADPDNFKHVYAPGVGPDLRGLFTQSNLGIVSAAVIQLEKKQARHLMSLVAPEAHLVQLTDILFSLRERGILQDGLLLTGMQDPRTSAGERIQRGNWFASASLQGSLPMQEAAMLEVRHALEALSLQLNFYPIHDMPANPEPEYLSIVAGMYQGIPSNYALETMARLGGTELNGRLEIDEAKDVIGFVCALPAVPFEGVSVSQVIGEVDTISLQFGLQPYYNFVGLTATSLEGFFRVFFSRDDPDAIQRAHQWNEAVHKRLLAIGMPPYRINIEQMKLLYENPQDSYWQLISTLKSALDPHHILAPGRHCPPNNDYPTF